MMYERSVGARLLSVRAMPMQNTKETYFWCDNNIIVIIIKKFMLHLIHS